MQELRACFHNVKGTSCCGIRPNKYPREGKPLGRSPPIAPIAVSCVASTGLNAYMAVISRQLIVPWRGRQGLPGSRRQCGSATDRRERLQSQRQSAPTFRENSDLCFDFYP